MAHVYEQSNTLVDTYVFTTRTLSLNALQSEFSFCSAYSVIKTAAIEKLIKKPTKLYHFRKSLFGLA